MYTEKVVVRARVLGYNVRRFSYFCAGMRVSFNIGADIGYKVPSSEKFDDAFSKYTSY